MSNIEFPVIGGESLRVTKVDRCGVPAWGDAVQAVSDGFVSVAVTAQYDDGTEVTVTNARGRRCVNRAAEPELISLSLAVVFCKVDPDIYTAVTGYPKIIDAQTGDSIGFRINRGVRPSDVRWALEVWADAEGSEGCTADGDVQVAYLLWPFLQGARIGDYTIENNAVTFTATGAITKDGSQWGVGPYDVTTDDGGDPGPLNEAIDHLDHQITFVTTVGPPEVTNGLVPLDDPDGAAATGATAGLPGHFTPTGARRPADFPALVAATLTKSPTTVWAPGTSVILGDGSKAHWSGTAWVEGPAA